MTSAAAVGRQFPLDSGGVGALGGPVHLIGAVVRLAIAARATAGLIALDEDHQRRETRAVGGVEVRDGAVHVRRGLGVGQTGGPVVVVAEAAAVVGRDAVLGGIDRQRGVAVL